MDLPVIEADAILESHSAARGDCSYRPYILWNGEVVWKGPATVPFEHGDYNFDQKAQAKAIAENHIVEKLQELFE